MTEAKASTSGLRSGDMAVNRDVAIGAAVRALGIETKGLQALQRALAGELAPAFVQAVETLLSARGRVITTGMGKSGHIGDKIAATFASTGTPAFFVHPGEASHGDLGMICADDVIVALSWSGETRELKNTINYARRFRVPLIGITAHGASGLAVNADVALVLPDAPEACPHGLAPTTSALLQLAIGDALAVALLEVRGFSARDFGLFHPGGRLGALLASVGDIMHRGDAMPLVPLGTPMTQAILVMSQKGFGCVGVYDEKGAGKRLRGIITDGDLRRHIDNDLLARTVEQVMTPAPKTLPPGTLVSEAVVISNESRITALFVVEDDAPVGIVHMHDLLRIGAA